jgi:putative Mg2+ transporter-C (MgtC) family protein
MLTIYELATRLILAVVLGGFIGWERTRKQKPANLKVHILVSLGAAVLTIISFAVVPEMKNVKVSGVIDPTRIASGVIVFIGFLVAGSIIRSVISLATAAGIFLVAGIGMACGFGLYELAIIAALLIVVTLIIMEKIEERGVEIEKPRLIKHEEDKE